MKVFVTGVEGYIGALLVPVLMERGHDVTGFDTGFYRDGWLYSDQKEIPRFALRINNDLRRISEADLAGFDAVVHLAELSNDPLGQNNPATTFKINHAGSVALARKAKRVGISRFVYTSSCSVYGIGTAAILDETGEVNPQTAYAQCKVNVERDVGAMADDSFSPVFLRNATAYGASPRMRFDIVLNNLAGLAWTAKKIAMTSDGTPWRPLVHVRDICTAIACAVEAPANAIHNEKFNVGHNGDNYRVREIAEIVAEAFPGCELSFGKPSADNRSYRVSFDKIHRQLPHFKCEWDARRGAQQLSEVFARIAMSRETFAFRAFTRLMQLEYLIKTGQIDDEFFWTH
jgi:nucleoside-diphosphate-sugar epimerase